MYPKRIKIESELMQHNAKMLITGDVQGEISSDYRAKLVLSLCNTHGLTTVYWGRGLCLMADISEELCPILENLIGMSRMSVDLYNQCNENSEDLKLIQQLLTPRLVIDRIKNK